MELVIVKDYSEMSCMAADQVISAIKAKPDCTLGLATGSTPLGMYERLISEYRKGNVDFSRVKAFNLDEYVGLGGDHPQSYKQYMWQNFYSHVNIRPENTFIPDGTAPDLEAECAEYERKIERAGYIDLQILGIGGNGHIGFNEPGTDLGAETHVLELSDQTRAANSRFFGSMERTPRYAITMGIKTIMRSRKIVLLASGADKARAISLAVSGPVSTQTPASVLQLHPNVLFVVDESAAAMLDQAAS